MTRKEILSEVEKCICSDRNVRYGEPLKKAVMEDY